MSTFSKPDFNAEKYLSYRPSYNQEAYNHIFREHKGELKTAADIGCGPGNVTIHLAKRVQRVIGIDPSSSMIQVAREKAKQQGLINIEYRQGYGEKLPLENQSVDIITVAQSLHWLDPNRFLSEVIRVLRPRGTLIAWGYMFGKTRLLTSSTPAEYDDTLAQLGDPTKGGLLGAYWEKNRAIATAGFISWLPAFQQVFNNVQHLSYPEKLVESSTKMATPWMDDSTLTLEQLILYVKTWSSYRNWLDESRKNGKEIDHDVVDDYFKQRFPDDSLSSHIQVQWPHSVFILSQALPHSTS